MRRPRSDSKLDALDMDQQRQLCEWLLTPGLAYEVIKKMVFEEFNVSTSSASLSSFYQSYCGAYLVQRRMQAVGIAEEIAQEAQKQPGQFDSAAIDALKQKSFELASSPNVNPKDVKALFSLVLKARDQELKQKDIDIKLRRLEVLERQEVAAKGALTDTSLSAEEREQRMKAVFGLA